MIGAPTHVITMTTSHAFRPWVSSPKAERSMSRSRRVDTHGLKAWLVVIVITCVGAPIIEELFFRGLVQTRLVGRLGVAPGIVLASLLFGAAHMINWQGVDTFTYAWAIAGGGLVLGVIRHVSGRLGPGIVAHAIFNAMALLLIQLVS